MQGLIFGVPFAVAITTLWWARWPVPTGLRRRTMRLIVLGLGAAILAEFWAYLLLLGIGALVFRVLAALESSQRPAPVEHRRPRCGPPLPAAPEKARRLRGAPPAKS